MDTQALSALVGSCEPTQQQAEIRTSSGFAGTTYNRGF
jgi:hypothetical protein